MAGIVTDTLAHGLCADACRHISKRVGSVFSSLRKFSASRLKNQTHKGQRRAAAEFAKLMDPISLRKHVQGDRYTSWFFVDALASHEVASHSSSVGVTEEAMFLCMTFFDFKFLTWRTFLYPAFLSKHAIARLFQRIGTTSRRDVFDELPDLGVLCGICHVISALLARNKIERFDSMPFAFPTRTGLLLGDISVGEGRSGGPVARIFISTFIGGAYPIFGNREFLLRDLERWVAKHGSELEKIVLQSPFMRDLSEEEFRYNRNLM